jgi:hypothetical protein
MVRFFYKVDVQQKAKILRKARPPPRPCCAAPAPLPTDARRPRSRVVCTCCAGAPVAWRGNDPQPNPNTAGSPCRGAGSATPSIAAAAQVAFPLVLDVYEFCSAELKKELEGPREAARAAADRAAGLEKAAKVGAPRRLPLPPPPCTPASAGLWGGASTMVSAACHKAVWQAQPLAPGP